MEEKTEKPEQRGSVGHDADLIIIGAGPAGMSAAIEAATGLNKVIVLDMQPEPGGQIFRSLESNFRDESRNKKLLQVLGKSYSAGKELIAKFRSAENIEFRPDTTVWDVRSDGTVGWLKGQQAGYIRAPFVILANGAQERPVPFPGWELPGVMSAGAIQTAIKSGRIKPQGNIVLAGTGPLLLLLANQLRKLGIKPKIIARTDSFKNQILATHKLTFSAFPQLVLGLSWILKLKMSGIPSMKGISSIAATGKDKVESVKLYKNAVEKEIACDLLIVHDGVVPSIDLTHCVGGKLDWIEELHAWQPSSGEDGNITLVDEPLLIKKANRVFISGDAREIGGAEASIAHGRLTGRTILKEFANIFGSEFKGDRSALRKQVKKAKAYRPFIDAAFPVHLSNNSMNDETIICRCEEITVGTIRAAIRDGIHDINHLRGTTRCGMGSCQGRNCMASIAKLLNPENNNTSNSVPPYRSRPPVRPVSLGAMASLQGLDPELSVLVSLEDKPDSIGNN